MAWTLNGIRIYVNKLSTSNKQIIARLQPLAGPTVQQVFGYEKDMFKVGCRVVTESKVNQLKALAQTGTTYTLAGNNFTSVLVYINSVNADRSAYPYQTVEGNVTDPLFDVDLELSLA